MWINLQFIIVGSAYVSQVIPVCEHYSGSLGVPANFNLCDSSSGTYHLSASSVSKPHFHVSSVQSLQQIWKNVLLGINFGITYCKLI